MHLFEKSIIDGGIRDVSESMVLKTNERDILGTTDRTVVDWTK